MNESLKPLLERPEASKFTGPLELRFESGQIASAKLEHFLPYSEFGRELPLVEPETEFSLKP
jgi:hypothetical protein